MNNATMKPTIPEVLDRFDAYRAENPAWGSLHVVLADVNVGDSFVQGCIDRATERGDTEGAELARLLLRMSKTQRRKLAAMPPPDMRGRGRCVGPVAQFTIGTCAVQSEPDHVDVVWPQSDRPPPGLVAVLVVGGVVR